jgi:hypothetical protein
MVINESIIMGDNVGTNVDNGVSNIIKLGIFFIVLAVVIGGIVIILQPAENLPSNGGQDGGEPVVFSEGELFEVKRSRHRRDYPFKAI